jgi:hypothetical protein
VTAPISIKPLPIEIEPLSSRDYGYPSGNRQWIYRFPNGFGASVVQGDYTYGGSEGFLELAVLKFDGDKSSLTYSTPITDDVLGWLTVEAVAATLLKVAAL